MKELNNTKIIAIDHGYGNIKTANTVTPTGITAYKTEPIFSGNILEYDLSLEKCACGLFLTSQRQNRKAASAATDVRQHSWILEYTSSAFCCSYNGMYYRVGEGHKEFIADKAMDEDYYLLTLMAVARELNICGIRTANVHLAAGRAVPTRSVFLWTAQAAAERM